MKQSDISLLLFIAQQAGLHGVLHSSTAAIAHNVGISQQSVSRKLRELETEQLINRQALANGVHVSLSARGKKALHAHFSDLQTVFGTPSPSPAPLKGTVQTGLGEGRYYLGFSQYTNQFEKIFGFSPYPGTLNLEVNEQERESFLAGLHPHSIDGFSTPERTFGGLTAYKITIKKLPACLIIPDRSNHPKNLVEVVAAPHLRSKLSLKDGSSICLTAVGA
jgi:riboflavin kinase, archaea type